jgi:hypothetical protein
VTLLVGLNLSKAPLPMFYKFLYSEFCASENTLKWNFNLNLPASGLIGPCAGEVVEYSKNYVGSRSFYYLNNDISYVFIIKLKSCSNSFSSW